MKRQIVTWLTASLLISGVARAQEPQKAEPKKEPTAAELLGLDEMTPEQEAARDLARGWKVANPKLKTAGWTMVILGGLMAVPWGTAVHLPGQDYCVKSTDAYVDVQSGGCGLSSLQMKASLFTMATGGVLAAMGGRHVAVKPTLTPTVKAATVQVSW